MSRSTRVHIIRLPLRKIGAALPAVVLISGGIIMSASAAPTAGPQVRPASAGSPVVEVPSIALTVPGSAQALTGPGPAHAPRTPLPAALTATSLVPMVPAGTVAGSSSLVTLDSAGIPVRALDGYRGAVSLINAADPACHLDWALLGAIGRVESDHARFGGNHLDSAGVAQPGIIGIALDGTNGTARVTDTDRGLLDRDTTYDRAVGPMQFIPSTWRFAGVDANGDGVKDPQNMADSAAATGRYLCSGPGDLRRPGDLRSAILRYNASDSYVSMVTAIANAYRHGVRALPAVDLAPARPSTVALPASRPVPKAARAATRRQASPPTKPLSVRPSALVTEPAVTPRVPAPTTSTPAPTPASTQTTTTRTVPPTTITTTAPTCLPATSAPGTASPTTTEPCVPSPCATATTTTSTASPTGTASPNTPAGSGSCAITTATTGPSSTSTSAP